MALAPRGVGLAAGRRGAPAPRAGATLCPVGADGLGAAGLCLDVRRLALAGSGRLPCLACRLLGGGRIAGIRGGGGGVRPGGALRCGEERCRTARGRLERRDSRCAALVGRVLSGGALPHADAGTDGLGDEVSFGRVVPLGGPGASDGGHGLGGTGAVSSADRCAGTRFRGRCPGRAASERRQSCGGARCGPGVGGKRDRPRSLSQGADGPGPAVGAHRHGDAVRAYRPVLAYEPRFPLAVLREHGGYGSSGGGSGHAGGGRRS